MSLDLGDLESLAAALGLLDSGGALSTDWFSRPGHYLTQVLRDQHQREALATFVSDLLAEGQPSTDAQGRQWLPVAHSGNGAFTAYGVIGQTGSVAEVGAGARVDVTTPGGVRCTAQVHAPLFGQPVGGGAATVLIGSAHSPVDVTVGLTLPAGTQSAGVGLGGVMLTASIPTHPSEAPAFGLTLTGLQLPGAAGPSDLTVSVESLADLEHAVLHLVLGLVQAEVSGLAATDPLRGLAVMLGLVPGDVPAFPVDDLLARGPVALADWVATALGAGAARGAWLAGLAALVGGSVAGTGADTQVSLAVGPAQLLIGMTAVAGTSGRPRITPTLTLTVDGAAGVTLVLEVDPVRLDLGTGTAVAVPALRLAAQLRGAGGQPLLAPITGPSGLAIGVGGLDAGLALDVHRRPVLVLQALGADVGATHFDVLDLSSPEALAADVQQVVTDAAASLLHNLGPAGIAVGVVLGLADAPDGTPLSRVDAARLLSDPVGALAARWDAVLTSGQAAVEALLGVIRDAVGDAGQHAVPITGDGSADHPWLLPLAGGVALTVRYVAGVLSLGLDAALTVDDVAGSSVAAALGAQLHLVELGLAGTHRGRAAFLAAVSGDLRFTRTGGGQLTLGEPPAALTASAVGLGLSWTTGVSLTDTGPTAGLRVRPVADGVALEIAGSSLPLPTVAADGSLVLDGAAWAAVEALVVAGATALAGSAGTSWPLAVVDALGWSRSNGLAGSGGWTGPYLSLAALAADPQAALRAEASALADVATDTTGLQSALQLLAALVGSSVASLGGGRPDDPWRVPLLGTAVAAATDAVPSLFTTVDPQGPLGPATTLRGGVAGWQPGDPDLSPAALVTALAQEATLDPELADLLAGRGDVLTGLTDLSARWLGTDGLVTLPETGLPAGLTPHWVPDLVHSTRLTDLDLSAVDGLGAAAQAATVVHVAVLAPGLPAVLADPGTVGLTADHVLDLTQGGRPPGSFGYAAPADPTGLWTIRLGSRAACRLDAGDPDGVAGQTARLSAVLPALVAAAGGPVLVVAHGAAGHPAVRAASSLTGVAAVVTVGTPWSPVSADTLDQTPGAESLRLLAAVLPAVDEDDPDDADLALARSLLDLWLRLDPLPDPLLELRPPGAATQPGTVAVHALVGSLGDVTVRRAFTAVVAAGLSTRAVRRTQNPPPTATGTRAGIRLPLLPATSRGGLTCSAHVDLELGGAAVPDDGSSGGDEAATTTPTTTHGPAVVVHLTLGSATGWLVGGPDPGRAPGIDRPLALRRISARVRIPLAGAGASTGILLHDATAFGVRVPRWSVAVGPEAPSGSTSALPEVRALLAEVATRIDQAAADPLIAGLRDALAAVGLLSTGGATGSSGSPSTALGIDPVTLDRLVADPGGVAGALRSDPARRSALAAALRALAGDTRPAGVAADTVALTFGTDPTTVTATLDLGGGTAGVSAAGPAGVGWSLGAEIGRGAAGAVTASGHLRLGPDLPPPAGTAAGGAASGGTPVAEPGAVAQGAALLVDAAPLAVRVRTATPAGSTDVTLWPAPDAAAVGAALEQAVPAALLHAVLQALRTRLANSGPTAAAAVDAVADALGLLGAQPGRPAGSSPDDALPARPLRLPAALLADPAGWLRSLNGGAGTLTTVVPALLDALRGVVGGGTAPGVLQVAPGLALRAGTSNGRLLLAADVVGADFAAGGAVGRLVLAGTAGLSLDAAGSSPRPDVALQVTIAGVGAVRLGVAPGPDGTVGVTLAVHPDGGADIPILPAGPGLGAAVGAAAAAAALKALPALLDTVAGRDPAGTPAAVDEVAGRVVSRLGDALGLRSGTPRRFDAATLSTFGPDPAAALAARAPAIAAAGLSLLVDAAQPLLGSSGTRSVATVGSAVVLTVGPTTLSWEPGSSKVTAGVLVASGLPGVESLAATVGVDPTGLTAFDVTVGPAQLAAGPLTVRPFARVVAGTAPPGGRAVEVGLGVGPDARLVARAGLGGGAPLALLSRTGPTGASTDSTDPVAVVLAALRAVTDIAGSVVLAVPVVSSGLDRPLLGSTARALLTGVLLDPAHTDHLDPDLLDATKLLHRLGAMLRNLAGAPGATITIDGALTLGPHARGDGAGGTVFGLTLGLSKPWQLGGGDITVSLEPDAAWIQPPPAGSPGITVEVLALDAQDRPVPQPGVGVDGIAVRIARSSGPLLNSVISIESVALSVFADVAVISGAVQASGGAKLELAGLSAALGGASGGDNAVAGGLLGSGGPGDAPKPRFSPSIAVQKHGTDPATVTFSAGDGAGPWWVVIQRGFGPIYIEQVGLAVTMSANTLASVGLLIDGKVSLLGLTASVDDLSITYLVSVGSPLDSRAWAVDLAGLAVTADLGGMSLAGGLRKFAVAEGGVQYLGLLMARLAVYGISVYGGYGLVGPSGDQYASLFLFGAVNGPIGGPPAFFVTGIGGGFGINRGLTYPSDLSQFENYPFLKALDPAARPGDPMTELEQIRGYFPPDRGSFWFAAGLSFTSFALVDGVVVIAVQIGDGFELSLLGLARMALPRPQAALVSIELALLARVSTKEGVVLVQAALTDNSWLLFEGIRLTGGFAFASWFGGPNRGQFVVTLGGYHPSFHRDGYPVVPRLGLSINLFGFLSITGETYFALTSEAVMAGASITASADFGIAWAHLTFGGDGIIFFDPFWLHLSVYASISAGITIDVWIGTITISVSLSAQVDITGPPYYGVATFSVGPSTLTVPFGDTPPAKPAAGLSWAEFVPKYLQEAAAGVAHVLGAIAGQGAAVPAGSASSGGARSPDGSDANPFLMAPEFGLTVTSQAPVRELIAGGTTTDLPTQVEVSAAPMRQPARPSVTLAFVGPSHADPEDRIAALSLTPQALGAFPIGVWGPAQTQDDAKVPAGNVLAGVDRVLVTGSAIWATSPNGAPDIPLRQVEVGDRRPLPFVTEGSPAQRTVLADDAQALAGTVPAVGAGGVTMTAAQLLAQRAGRSPADVAAWAGGRRSQPILGSLGEGLGLDWMRATVELKGPPVPPPAPLRLPVVRALLAMPVGLEPVPTVSLAAPAAHGLLAGPGTAGQAPATPADQGGAGAGAAGGGGAGAEGGGGAGAEGGGGAGAESPQAVGGPRITAVSLRGTGPTTTVSPALLAGVAYAQSPPAVLASVDSGLTAAIPARLLRQPDPAVAAGPTVLATGAVPISRSGRSGVEAVDGRGGSQVTRSYLGDLTAALDGDGGQDPAGGQDAGMAIGAGTVAVLHAPDADRDVDPAHRPALGVVSGSVRVVAVGPAGTLLAESAAQAGDAVTVPAGTRVVAVLAVDPDPAAAAGDGGAGLQVYGWDSASPLPYLGDEMLLAAGGVVLSAGRVPWRRYARVGLGWVTPSVVASGASAVTTRFSHPVDTVAVALEGGSGDDLALGLAGATRVRDADGRSVPPVVVADGPRAVAVFAIVPTMVADGTASPVDVTVTTGQDRHLAGVAATSGSGVDALAAAVAARGFAAVVPDPVPTGIGRAIVAWKQA